MALLGDIKQWVIIRMKDFANTLDKTEFEKQFDAASSVHNEEK